MSKHFKPELFLLGLLIAYGSGCARGTKMMVNKPYPETVSALYHYGREVKARTNDHYNCSMDEKRAGKSYTLSITIGVRNSFDAPDACITIKPERHETTSIRVLSDWWGPPLGLFLGTRDRKLEKVTLEEFVDFLNGRTFETNDLPRLHL